MGGWWGRRWARWWVKILKRKAYECIRSSYGPLRSLNSLRWREMHSRCLCLTPQNCAATHSHPQTSQAAIWTPCRLLVWNAIVLQKSSQQKHTTKVLSMKFESFFMYYCVQYEKSILLSWVIRPVFADPVTYTSKSHILLSQYLKVHNLYDLVQIERGRMFCIYNVRLPIISVINWAKNGCFKPCYLKILCTFCMH